MAAKPKDPIAETVSRAEYEALEKKLSDLTSLIQENLAGPEERGRLDTGDIVNLIQRTAAGAHRRPDYQALSGEARQALDAIDPLNWIREDTQVVHLIGRIGSTPLRHQMVLQNGVKIEKMRLRPIDKNPQPWLSCPYIFGARHFDMDVNMDDVRSKMLQNSKWFRFRVTRQMAEQGWMGRDPFPLQAVICPTEFEGVHGGMVYGRERQSSGIALREKVRELCQLNGQELWLDTDVYCPNAPNIRRQIENLQYRPWPHAYVEPQYAEAPLPEGVTLEEVLLPCIDPYEPNPYHRGCVAAVGTHTPISPFGAEGRPLNTGHSGRVAEMPSLDAAMFAGRAVT